uniref:Uncharacterized protein n=1 Tax=Anguilla anguilla TaxID=7936 RepID=A0A0E9WWW2_ANGAN
MEIMKPKKWFAGHSRLNALRGDFDCYPDFTLSLLSFFLSCVMT